MEKVAKYLILSLILLPSFAFAWSLNPTSGTSFSDGVYSGVSAGDFPDTDQQVVVTDPNSTEYCFQDIYAVLGSSFTFQELLDHGSIATQNILGTWSVHTSRWTGTCNQSLGSPFGSFELTTSGGGGTPPAGIPEMYVNSAGIDTEYVYSGFQNIGNITLSFMPWLMQVAWPFLLVLSFVAVLTGILFTFKRRISP